MNKKISSRREPSIVDTIIKNAPVKKTKQGAEKKVLLSTLKKKFRAGR